MDRETSENVTIVVKSPYQNFSDQTLSCPTEWSVEQLKEEIMHLCPSHPTVKEQKLIYWGKLLEDKVKLRDTLKIYEEGQANHTVHLILKRDQSYVKAEGLRKRNLASTSTTSPPSPAPSSSSQPLPSPHDPRLFPWGPAYFNPGAAAAPFSPAYYNPPGPTTPFSPAYFNPGAAHPSQATPNTQYTENPAQAYQFGYQPGHLGQVTAMQQAYVQYMQQYMHLMMGGAMPAGTPPTFMQAPPPRPAHQEPNVNNPEAADERPRDWLDWFYMSSRALIFLTVVCFYSSPFRFLLVLVIGFAIYLYQSGFFRYPGPALLMGDPPQGGVPAPPPAQPNEPGPSSSESAAPPAADSPRPSTPSETLPSDTPPATDVENNSQSTTIPTSSAAATEHAQSTIPTGDQPTLLGLTWSIVANFFASLLPDQPGII